ncbi:hypothetical protein [Alkalicoccobacillus plakortidis]|uniref:Uncharacterized protein n=1 Tax=Alkalicoccobacillus plakortidis TaxID=444060 RepID=A0ABT0XEB8_9BACI|nr:hypothetical protein [Alkalicoccobacillus plakortidis]MCM2674160.1 hypothetical protein [Alkalicoccobacillus plakortidis]
MTMAFSLVMTWYVGTDLRGEREPLGGIISPSDITHSEYITYSFDQHFFPYPFMFITSSFASVILICMAAFFYLKRSSTKTTG